MIFGQTTEKSIEMLKSARGRYLTNEKVLAAQGPVVVVKRFRLMELDRACEDEFDTLHSKCQCGDDPHASRGGFTAFPNDTSKMLLCCAECGTIHYIGEE